MLLQTLMTKKIKTDEVLTETEGMKLCVQSNHVPVELQQILEDGFFKLDSLICFQPLTCVSLPPFFISSSLCVVLTGHSALFHV